MVLRYQKIEIERQTHNRLKTLVGAMSQSSNYQEILREWSMQMAAFQVASYSDRIEADLQEAIHTITLDYDKVWVQQLTLKAKLSL